MTMSDEGARDGLLRRAQSLLDEAAAQSGVVILGAQRGRHIAGPATEGDGSVWSAPQASRPAVAAQLSSCSMFAAQERE
jgi:hypothetical protein